MNCNNFSKKDEIIQYGVQNGYIPQNVDKNILNKYTKAAI
jgi:hypothetical protein